MKTVKTYCSICSAFCGLEADVDDNRIVALRPDASHPMSQGFSCSKGRHFHHLLYAPERVVHCRRRRGESWERVDRAQALDEIAARLRTIIDEHGPDAVAVFCGNGVTFKAVTMPVVHGFLQGVGSHQLYSSMTIDQPAKIFSVARHGVWAGGGHSFASARVLMLIGNNVLVSGLQGPGSIPGWRPGALKTARERGLKLIVVDPRRTETARQADIHLPIKPGTDAALLAGMIRWVLVDGREDRAFCARFTTGLDALRAAVEPYDLPTTAAITGLEAEAIEAAIRLFVEQERGTVSSGTGPDMAPHANLSEHLIYSLNTLCGRHNRAGDSVGGSLLTPDFPPLEAVVPRDYLPAVLNPARNARLSRVRGARQLYQEMPTATLAEEILTPGEGQIRALIVIGGNPLLSIAGQAQMRQALQQLDLCVCIDGRASATAAHAHYLLPASYGLERTELTAFNDLFWDKPFHQISQPVVEAPADAWEEYRYLSALAQRLGTSIPLAGGALDTADPPDALDVMELIYPPGSTRVSLRELAAHAQGRIYPQFEELAVLPAPEGMNDKLDFMPPGVAEEFAQLGESVRASTPGDELLLICRRNPHVYNSMCHGFPQAPRDNPALLHSADLAARGLMEGERVAIRSTHGEITTTLRADDSLRRGVIAMHHGFGGEDGVAVTRLLSTEGSTDHYTHMPQMTAVPVRVHRGELASEPS